MCQITDFRYNAEYNFFENSTVSVTSLDDSYLGYFGEAFRWEHSDNVSVIGYHEIDWMKWSAWENCQWEGESYAGDTRWYCIIQRMVTKTRLHIVNTLNIRGFAQISTESLKTTAIPVRKKVTSTI